MSHSHRICHIVICSDRIRLWAILKYDPYRVMSWCHNIIHVVVGTNLYRKIKLIYCFQLHFQLWNGNVNWNQIFSKLCLTELWWGEGFTLIEWWKFPMEKNEITRKDYPLQHCCYWFTSSSLHSSTSTENISSAKFVKRVAPP